MSQPYGEDLKLSQSSWNTNYVWNMYYSGRVSTYSTYGSEGGYSWYCLIDNGTRIPGAHFSYTTIANNIQSINLKYDDYNVGLTTPGTGYVFQIVRWSKPSYKSTAAPTLTYGGTITINVEARYRVTVKFDANGGSGSSTVTYDQRSFTPITSASVKPKWTPARVGYDFIGWDTSSAATNPVVAPYASYYFTPSPQSPSNANIEYKYLWAVWIPAFAFMKLQYDANGGTGAPGMYSTAERRTYLVTVTITIPSTVPSRNGYEFKGWSTSKTASTADYQPGGTISLSESRYDSDKYTLYAVWHRYWYSVLKYNANTGTGAPSYDITGQSSFDKPGDAPHTVSAVVPTLQYYKLKGWSTIQHEPGKGEPMYQAGDSVLVPFSENMTDGSVTLYAVWARAFSLYANDNGTWKEVEAVYCNVNGTWKEAQSGYANDHGTWKQ